MRRNVRTVQGVNGMYHLNGLLICRGKTLEYTPDEEVRTGAVVLENVLTDDRKAMAGMGTKVLIWPDKVAFDTGTGELTRLGAQWEMGGKSVTVTPCDAEGRTYTPAGAGKTEPKEPEDGQLFLKSDSDEAYDSNAVLLRYSAKNKKWVEVLLSAVKIRCPGIGGVIREGDTVTISGMPDAVCNAVAKGLNGEVMIQTMDGDEMVAVLTRAEDSDRYYGSWTVTETGVTWKSADGTVTENDAAAAPVKVERRVPELDFVTEQGNRVWGCSRKENTIYACALGDPTNWYSYQGIAADSYAVSVGSDGAFTGAASCLGYLLFFKENCIHKLYGTKQRALPGRGGKRSEQPVRDRRDAVLSFAGRGDGMGRKPADKGIRCAGHQRADCGGLGHGGKHGHAVLPVPAPESRRPAGRTAFGIRHGKRPVARGKRCRHRDGIHRAAAVPVGRQRTVGRRS